MLEVVDSVELGSVSMVENDGCVLEVVDSVELGSVSMVGNDGKVALTDSDCKTSADGQEMPSNDIDFILLKKHQNT